MLRNFALRDLQAVAPWGRDAAVPQALHNVEYTRFVRIRRAIMILEQSLAEDFADGVVVLFHILTILTDNVVVRDPLKRFFHSRTARAVAVGQSLAETV